MEGRNILTLCLAEMKVAIRPYVDARFGEGCADIVSIQTKETNLGSSFIIELIGTKDKGDT